MNKQQIKIPVPCQRCHPVAMSNPKDKKPCPVCGGKGYVVIEQ